MQHLGNSGIGVSLLVVSSKNRTLATLNQTDVYWKVMRKLTEWKEGWRNRLRDNRGHAIMGVSVAGTACGHCRGTAARLKHLQASLSLLSSHGSAQGAKFQERVSHLLTGHMSTRRLGESRGALLYWHPETFLKGIGKILPKQVGALFLKEGAWVFAPLSYQDHCLEIRAS